MYTLTIDWGETYGYVLLNEKGECVVCGSCPQDEINTVLPLFASINNLIIVVESDPTGKNKFINLMLVVLRTFYDIHKIVYISPALWKYSSSRAEKLILSKHTQDAYRQAKFFQKINEVV